MATWEDGPEYAPHERPQYYADAPVAPLEQVPPAPRPADGLPAVRPRFDQPSAPLAPLEELVPEAPDERDPNRPFDVVTATLTTESAWGSPSATTPTAPFPTSVASVAAPAHGSPWPVLEQPAPGTFLTPQPPAGPTAGAPSPTGQRGPGAQPAPGSPPAAPSPWQYPAPGTPGWFAPPPTSYGEQPPGKVGALQVVEAATPALCICLALGGLYLFAPVMLLVAVFLSTRVKVAQRPVRIAFRVAAGAVGFFAVVGLFRTVVDGDPWWSFVAGWSTAVCWVMLGVLLLTVWQALTRPAPPTRPWG